MVNRLGVLGKPFDSTEEGSAKANARIEIGDKLIAEGKVPSSLDVHWEGHGSIANDGHSFNIEETRTMIGDVRSGKLPPETLEQHPIFRNVVKRCRELFGSAVSILSVSYSFIVFARTFTNISTQPRSNHSCWEDSG